MRLHFRHRLRLRRGLTNFNSTSTRATIGFTGTSLPAWSSPHTFGTGPIIGSLAIIGMILLLAALGAQ